MVGKRIAALRKSRGLSQAELAQRLGISRGRLANYEQGQREPDFATMSEIAKFFGVSIDYLVTGKEPDRTPTFEMYPAVRMIQVPILAEIPCGGPTWTAQQILGYFPVDTSVIHTDGSDVFWVYAKGDSMIEAGIEEGAMVLIRVQPTAENGDIVAVRIDGEEATLKRIAFDPQGRTVTLIPANRTMMPMTYTADRVQIIGKAIWVGRRL